MTAENAVVLLETERLVLTTWTETGTDEVFTLHADPEVDRYLHGYLHGWSRDTAAERVAGWQREHAEFGLGKQRLSRKSDGAFVGRAGFSINDGNVLELGYSLAQAHWSQGYASEIAQALSDWLFATRAETHFIGFAHRENAASRRVLEKIGMLPTHEAMIEGMPHQFYRQDRRP
jgi:[ribosomal protein S5]-alanine N-acetyltransferase